MFASNIMMVFMPTLMRCKNSFPSFSSRSAIVRIVHRTFTKDEAVDFLQNSWKIENVETRLRMDRKKFLDELIVMIRDKVPFQLLDSIQYPLIPHEKRALPNFEEINKICMAGHGGNCFFLNLFTRNLLCGLGYSAFACRVAVTSVGLTQHLAVTVKDLEKEGDIHLVDCGLGIPSSHVIPLNFGEESPVYRDSFLEYKFVRKGWLIFRMHGEGDMVKHGHPSTIGLDFIMGKWRRFYQFSVEAIDCQTVDDLGLYNNIGYVPYGIRPRAARFPEGRAVLITSDRLFIEKDDKTLEKTKLETDEEILNAYCKYFPNIQEDVVLKAYAVWQPNKLTSKL